jgi:hypothetical protein
VPDRRIARGRRDTPDSTWNSPLMFCQTVPESRSLTVRKRRVRVTRGLARAAIFPIGRAVGGADPTDQHITGADAPLIRVVSWADSYRGALPRCHAAEHFSQ